MKPFTIKSLEQPNTIQKMLRQMPKMNALIEVNNLLAGHEIDEITSGQIEDISQKYGIDVQKHYSNELLDLYREFVSYYLPFVTRIEKTRDDANKFLNLFRVTDNNKADDIWEVFAKKIYTEEYSKAIINGRLTSEIETYFSKLANMLNIPENVSNEISKDLRMQKVQSYIKEITNDGKVSPQEEQELNDMAKSLSINMIFDEKNQESLNKMKLLWKIENEDLPVLSPNVILPKKENCFYSGEVDWYEYRTQINRVNYSGPTVRVKILKGMYYRAGSLNVNTESREVLKKIDHGTLYISNKRLLFCGTNRNITIQLDKIIDFEKYSDGFKIVKDSGRNVFIAPDNDIDIPVAIVAKVMKDN
jgi:hypothetical protein